MNTRPVARVCRRLFASLLAVVVCTVGLAAEQNPPPDSTIPRSSRIRPFQPDRFTKTFQGTREDLKRRALDEAEKFHREDPKLPDALLTAIQREVDRNRTGESLRRATALYCRLDQPDLTRQQVELIRSSNLLVAFTAADVLSSREIHDALGPIVALRDRPEYRAGYAYRHAVVTVVGRFQDGAAVDFLIEEVERNHGQLRFEAGRLLTQLTGGDAGGRPEEWKRWWKDRRSQFDFAQIDKAAVTARLKDPLPWTDVLPVFFGAPVYAQRVVFVIDRSKSMASSVNEVTRLDEAVAELERALQALPADAWFNVLGYNHVVENFQPRLVPATPENKSLALRYAHALYADDRTAIYDALETALLVDDNLEAVYFLSDGEPTAGQVLSPVEIAHQITQMNAPRRTAIYTLGIDATGQYAQLLVELAKSNFGAFIPLR